MLVKKEVEHQIMYKVKNDKEYISVNVYICSNLNIYKYCD